MSGRETEAFSRKKSGRDWVQFVRFGLVGVMNTGVDFLVFTLLIWLGAGYMVAQTLSYAAGTLNSYIVNRSWTFRRAEGSEAESRRMGEEFVRFLILNVGTLLLSLAVLYLLKDGLDIPTPVAKVLLTGFTVAANYVGSKLWVFR
ncbi:GtrA family protein [Gorillibacterium sp. sgz5001074]|uniref:GtrA family protein n=1 Tax=Gorillibacterium sp. sgz5001074 TaxID=3446695 RepID=UPI003F667FF4